MITFLPYPDFAQSARVLDNKRLGNQRVEALILIHGGWKNHPASKMWANYREALIMYCKVICQEWQRRGYHDSILYKLPKIEIAPLPPWIGGEIHSTHRAALLYKNPEWYSQFGWVEIPRINYYWPS